jgi:hypothetical protein
VIDLVEAFLDIDFERMLGGVPITGDGGKNGLVFPMFSKGFTRYRDTTPRSIIPKTGGLSFAIVPRPDLLLRRRRRPLRPWLFTTSGCPLWPATT